MNSPALATHIRELFPTRSRAQLCGFYAFLVENASPSGQVSVPHSEMCAEFKVTRNTVYRWVSDLVAAGLIRRRIRRRPMTSVIEILPLPEASA